MSSHTAVQLAKRWSMFALQPSDVEFDLRLPSFSTTSQLLVNITKLTKKEVPKWYLGITLTVDTIFATYLVIGVVALIVRIRNRSFWIFRVQEGHIIPNGFNGNALAAGCFLVVWTCYSSVTLRGEYSPSATVVCSILMWLGAWMSFWGSVWSIPSTSAFGRQAFSARRGNSFFIFAPLFVCLHIGVVGVLHCVQYQKAVVTCHAVQRVLRREPSSAPVTQFSHEEAIKCWAHIISAFSYGSLFSITIAFWAFASGIAYVFVFSRLLGELKRMKKEHSQNSAAGAHISPEWNEGTGGAGNGAVIARHFEFLKEEDENAKLIFPPFKPVSSVSNDPTDVLFTKVLRSILLTGTIALLEFGLITFTCLFWAVAPLRALRSGNPDHWRVVHTSMDFMVSGAVVIAGVAVVLEAVMQNSQPVLGTWEYDVESSKRDGRFTAKLRQLTFLDRVSRVPKATRSHIERLSRPFFETKSAPAPMTHGFSVPGAPRARAFPEIGEEDEYSESPTIDEREESSSTTGKFDTQGSRTCLDYDKSDGRDMLSVASHLTSAPTRSVLHQREIELRIFPPSEEQTRVYFVRETSTTYEVLRTPRRLEPRRSEEAYRPTWRGGEAAPRRP